MHIIPHNLLSDERMWAHPCCTRIPQIKDMYHRMRRMKDAVMSSWEVYVVVSQSTLGCWIIVFIWCSYLSILYGTPLYIKDVTFVSVPWVIIYVRFNPSTLGDYAHARNLTPLNRDLVPLKPGFDNLHTRYLMSIKPPILYALVSSYLFLYIIVLFYAHVHVSFIIFIALQRTPPSGDVCHGPCQRRPYRCSCAWHGGALCVISHAIKVL
jgi:hypothetical protein